MHPEPYTTAHNLTFYKPEIPEPEPEPNFPAKFELIMDSDNKVVFLGYGMVTAVYFVFDNAPAQLHSLPGWKDIWL